MSTLELELLLGGLAIGLLIGRGWVVLLAVPVAVAIGLDARGLEVSATLLGVIEGAVAAVGLLVGVIARRAIGRRRGASPASR